MNLFPIRGSALLEAYGWEPMAAVREGSSSLRRLRETGLLCLEFKTGEKWYYFDVPVVLFEGFLSAASRGAYFSAHIRGRFNETPAEESDPTVRVYQASTVD